MISIIIKIEANGVFFYIVLKKLNDRSTVTWDFNNYYYHLLLL